MNFEKMNPFNGRKPKSQPHQPDSNVIGFLPPHPPAAESRKEESAYEKKLIGLFIDHYRKTGMCDYPVLKEVAKLAHTEGVLLSKKAGRLLRSLDEKLAEIDETASFIKRLLEHLENSFSNPEKYSDSIAKIGNSIKKRVKIIAQASDCLLTLTQKYAHSISGNGPGVAEEIDLNISKKINDIQYIAKYLTEQVFVDVAQFEFFENNSNHFAYFRRLRHYLNVLPNYCADLVEDARPKIQSKVAGTKFYN